MNDGRKGERDSQDAAAATRDEKAARQERLRGLAAVDEVLREPGVERLLALYRRDLVVDAVRAVIDRLRREILAGDLGGAAARAGTTSAAAQALTAADLVPWVERTLELAAAPSLRRVINAAGVVVHTNLGRSALPDEAVAAVARAASGYSDLEFGLATGERASRQDHVHDVLCTLTGAEDALVVNNNAAAVLLALAAVARGSDVLVARGQLVEIGDGFRIPDILRESGARLVEVGTTNRTYLRDFERAWGKKAKAVLRVHTSNYRIVGFTAEPSLAELAEFAAAHRGVLVDDLGSGALAELDLFAEEPSARESVAAGADVVTFSGDKLLGGPQAGIAVGKAKAIEAMRRHPLARAVRIDKLDLAALDVVLRLYLSPQQAVERIPTLAMLAEPLDAVRARAEVLRAALDAAAPDCGATVVDSVARAGAGALPVTEVPSVAVAVAPSEGDLDALAARLRAARPAVVGRVHEGRLLLDARTVRASEVADLIAVAGAALRGEVADLESA
jgi:L-seryl-tRNA(Ser) seleniumtransferase